MINKTPLQDETAVTVLPPSSELEDLASLQIDKSIRIATAPDLPKPATTYFVQKRIVDFLGSLFGLILLSPLLLILAIIIKLEDKKASIFFSQERIGINGRAFKMYKFRSMVSDAEKQLEALLSQNETTGAMFKMSNDPRVTKVGRFIRKTSLDELPQLWNVLKGDMSLVGPRPPLPREVKEYTAYDLQRLLALPGCTGLWQISGRSNIGFNEMVELDLEYIKSRSIKMDLLIILKTFKVLVGSKDAY
ncbi:sugar transferase [Exiguobacterium sp. ZOR0005]|uniref:sugar transferase n=1 Tax=Exiguobacterium sp. ZOR0005 TaxID=1339226 RepID=UPI000646E686|nr:sugar transferase [Exiguobacterium sp. ZOR0005]